MRLPVVLTFTLLAALSPLAQAAQPERFNLIAVVTDDQGLWTINEYGYPQARTPNLDRLVREGARFENAFTVTPVCSPSRVEYLTGRWGTEAGITDWISPAEAARGLGVPVSMPVWPEILQKAGYATALFGKWHLGDRPQFHPNRRGFDHFFGFLGGGTSPMDSLLERNGRPEKQTGYLEDRLTDDALRWMGDQREKPFAMLFHTRAPHLPYGPVPAEDAAAVADLDPEIPDAPGIDREQVKKWTRDYHASIHSVDRNLGRIMKKLDELNLSGKTVILFTSDHGYNIGHHTLHTKGNGNWIAGGQQGPKRPNMWDTSLRVPLIVRWPGVTKPGSRIPDAALNLDTFPTVLGILGVPAQEGLTQRGRDLAPLLRGQQLPARETFFGQYDLHNGGLAYMRMIRTPHWKLVRHFHATGLDELYNLRQDPGERQNLWNNPGGREARAELQSRLAEWMKSIDDPLCSELEEEPR